MKLISKRIYMRQISLSNLYLLSMVFTMLFLLIQKNDIVSWINWFGEDHLKELKYQLEQPSKGIIFLILQRLKLIAIMFALATTSMGSIYVYFNVIWFGVSSGFLITLVMLRYGLKGILLLTAGMFPHYLIYVPAIILTMILSKERRLLNGRFLSQVLMIMLVMMIGCALECYVNPDVIAKILKKY